MDQRFSDNTRRTSKLLYLVPSMLIQETFDMSVLEDVIEEYRDDIPNPDILEMEIKNWRSVFLLLPTEQVPTTIASAVKSINAINFPNVFVLLKLVATLPITSCECERSFSNLRRLKTWLRTTMDTDRLGALALMNVHYSHDISYSRASELFFQLHPRRMEMANLIFE